VAFRRIALITGLILLAVGCCAVYTGYIESKLNAFGVGQNTAWIFGDGPFPDTAIETTPAISKGNIYMTVEEIARYPNLKSYLDYMDTDAKTPHNSVSIDPREARSILLFISDRIGFELKPQAGVTGEWYYFRIDVSGNGYGVNILFSNNRPVLD
jgi:hypothetical protein